MVDSYRYYGDLLLEIELLEYQLDISLKERESWNIGGRYFHTVRLNVAALKMDKLSERIEWVSEQLEAKHKVRKVIEHKLSLLNSIEYKVAYLRIVKGKSLDEIADELGYSESWVKKVSMKVSRNLSGTDCLNSVL